jgi:hypothetical protein
MGLPNRFLLPMGFRWRRDSYTSLHARVRQPHAPILAHLRSFSGDKANFYNAGLPGGWQTETSLTRR